MFARLSRVGRSSARTAASSAFHHFPSYVKTVAVSGGLATLALALPLSTLACDSSHTGPMVPALRKAMPSVVRLKIVGRLGAC